MNCTRQRLPSRRHRRARCERCTLHTDLCVCAQLPRITTPLRWILVQHAADRLRPTNTGRLVVAMLENVEVLIYANRAATCATSLVEVPTEDCWLLYPAPEAEVLTPEMLRDMAACNRTLVLLDGTWRQTARMRRRLPHLRAMRCFRLPPAAPSTWSIRQATQPARLCTLETVIRLVALIGQPVLAMRMWEAMKWIEGRLLYMRGRRGQPPSLEDLRAELAGQSPPWQSLSAEHGAGPSR